MIYLLKFTCILDDEERSKPFTSEAKALKWISEAYGVLTATLSNGASTKTIY